jgi:hypothetical protein
MYVAEESDAASADEEAGPHEVEKRSRNIMMAGRRERFIGANYSRKCYRLSYSSLNLKCALETESQSSKNVAALCGHVIHMIKSPYA